MLELLQRLQLLQQVEQDHRDQQSEEQLMQLMSQQQQQQQQQQPVNDTDGNAPAPAPVPASRQDEAPASAPPGDGAPAGPAAHGAGRWRGLLGQVLRKVGCWVWRGRDGGSSLGVAGGTDAGDGAAALRYLPPYCCPYPCPDCTRRPSLPAGAPTRVPTV